MATIASFLMADSNGGDNGNNEDKGEQREVPVPNTQQKQEMVTPAEVTPTKVDSDGQKEELKKQSKGKMEEIAPWRIRNYGEPFMFYRILIWSSAIFGELDNRLGFKELRNRIRRHFGSEKD